jgi:hypothetical protein
MRQFLMFSLLIVLTACAGTTTQYERGDVQSVAAEVDRQQALAKAKTISISYKPTKLTDARYSYEDRLVMIAGRNLTAAAPYCGNRIENSFLMGVRAQADGVPFISAPIAVKADGEKNDVKFGDKILALNGENIGTGKSGIQRLVQILTDAENANQPVMFQVQRADDGRTLGVNLRPVMRCAFGVRVKNDKQINAYADGRALYFTTAIMDLLTDDELSFVVGHELAHNILEHVAKTQSNAAVGGIGGNLLDALARSQGIDTGGKLGNLGGQMGVMKYSQDFEREADYVGAYITTLAGFAPEAAISVIEKLSVENPKSISYASTHPANAERAVNARINLDEIRRKQAAGEPLLPSFKTQN